MQHAHNHSKTAVWFTMQQTETYLTPRYLGCGDVGQLGFLWKKKNLLLLLLNYCISTLIDWNHCYKHFTKSVNTWASATSSLQSSWMHPSPLVCVCVCKRDRILEWEVSLRDRRIASFSTADYSPAAAQSPHTLSASVNDTEKHGQSGSFRCLSKPVPVNDRKTKADDHKNSKCKCPLRHWFFN